MECGKSDIFIGLDSENPEKSSFSAFKWSNDAKDRTEDSEALGTAAQPDGRILGPESLLEEESPKRPAHLGIFNNV